MLYLVLKTLHIIFAITALGANLTYGPLLMRAEREPQHLLFMLRTIKWIDNRIANPSYALVLLTGFLLIWRGGYSFSLFWIWFPLSLFGVIGILGFAFYSPVLKKQVQLAEAGKTDTDEYRKVRVRSTALGITVILLVLVIVFLMVIKP